jgi:RNA polymerase-binding transcription factor DksA
MTIRQTLFREKLRANHHKLKNSIEKVVQETSSRAIVLTKEFDWPRSEGYLHKYVLVKVASSWLIEDKFGYCEYCGGTGRHERLFGSGKETCPLCKGNGWRSYWLTPEEN